MNRRRLLLCPLLLALLAPGAQAQQGLPPEDVALMMEFARGLRPELTSKKGQAELQGIVGALLETPRRQQLLATWLRHAKANLDEGGARGWIHHRTVTLAVLGPPGGIHREPSRAWSGQMAEEVGSPWNLFLKLAGQELAEEPPEAWPMEDPYPSEVWVYPTTDGASLRVLWFVDDEEIGAYRLVSDGVVPIGTAVSSAPRVDLPPELFGDDAGAAAVAEDRKMPELVESAVEPVLDLAFFKEAQGRTQTRFVVGVDPEFLELEFDVEPVEYLRDAELWLELSRDGQVIRLDSYPPSESALAVLAATGSYVDEIVSVPLVKGDVSYRIRLVDSEGRGGEVTGDLQVPDMGIGVLMSSVVLARAEGKGDDATLPKTDESLEFEPFRMGNYLVKPHLEGTFKPGDSLALVSQVYEPATVEYDLWRGPKLAGQLGEFDVPRPTTDIQILEVTEAWAPGDYRFKVTAKAKSGGGEVVREVQFKVKR